MSAQLIIILIYILVTITIGVLSKRRSQTAKDFHGASLGVVMTVAAGTGEWLGGTATTGVSEYGYEYGISASWYTLANSIGIIILAVFFAKLYRSVNTITVPGILEHFIGKNARLVSSALLIIVMLVVGTSQMVAIGSLGVTIIGMDYTISLITLGIGVICYTLLGGMNAVAHTNVLHVATMYGGMIIAIVLALKEVGGANYVSENLPPSYFNFTSIGFSQIISWVVASVLGACTAQAGIQPILAAKDTKTAQKAAFVTGALVAPFGLLTAYLGMIARVKFPLLANAKNALPTLMMSLNPVAGGLILSAIMAAILSTISPIMLSAGTMFTKDIYQGKINSLATESQVLKVSRLSTAVAGLFCILAAIFLYDSSRLLDMVYFAYTLRGAIFVILLFSIYWKKTTEKSAVIGMLTSSATGFFWVGYKAILGHYPFHPSFNETYAVLIVAAVITIAVSLKEYFLSSRKTKPDKSN